MNSSCELTIRLGIFEGVACGTYGTFLLGASVFALIGLAAFRLRLKWHAKAAERDTKTPLPSLPKPAHDRPKKP